MSKSIAYSNINHQISSMLLAGNTEAIIKDLDLLIEKSGNEVLVQINSFLSCPSNLSRLIELVLNDHNLFNQVLQNSYYHENGFHKIVLLSGNFFKLRLHHFGAGAGIPMENVHDHRWPFASSILTGKLKMDMFQISHHIPGGEELFHFVYNSDKTSGSYSATLQGKILIQKVKSLIYSSGQTYLMLPEELHRIKNSIGEDSITLILTGNPISRECNLYAKRSILEEEKKTVPYITQKLRKMLQDISEKVYPRVN